MNVNENISKVELLALIKQYNRNGVDKIMNVDRLKKEELMKLCLKYSLITSDDSNKDISENDLKNIPIIRLLQDVELFFLHQSKKLPREVSKMKKRDLIDYMILNKIPHNTTQDLEKEYNAHQRTMRNKNIIMYNIIRYDNVDVENLSEKNMEDFIEENNLDTDMLHFDAYTVFVRDLYQAYHNFCETTQKHVVNDKMRSLPKILKKLNELGV